MHVLGREMKVAARKPDGMVVPLIWVKNWDFNWQTRYVYAEPIQLPAGTRIDYVAWYDNSSGNVMNPNSPPQTVHWGNSSDDEMGICYFQVIPKSVRDFTKLNEDATAYYLSENDRFLKQHAARQNRNTVGRRKQTLPEPF